VTHRKSVCTGTVTHSDRRSDNLGQKLIPSDQRSEHKIVVCKIFIANNSQYSKKPNLIFKPFNHTNLKSEPCITRLKETVKPKSAGH